jgi:HEAT repeat protein
MPGCSAQKEGSKSSFWPFSSAKTPPEKPPDVTTPADQIAMLRKLAEEGPRYPAARQQQVSQVLATLIQRENDPLVRREVLRTLEKYPTGTAESVLTAGLRDPVPDVRTTACQVLGRRGGAAAVAGLSEVLSGDVDRDVRLTAAKALGQTRDKAAVSALGTALEDANPAMQYCAVMSLRQVTGKDFGNDVNRWRQFVQGQPEPGSRTPSIAEQMRRTF